MRKVFMGLGLGMGLGIWGMGLGLGIGLGVGVGMGMGMGMSLGLGMDVGMGLGMDSAKEKMMNDLEIVLILIGVVQAVYIIHLRGEVAGAIGIINRLTKVCLQHGVFKIVPTKEKNDG